jgi:hypothetical protein
MGKRIKSKIFKSLVVSPGSEEELKKEMRKRQWKKKEKVGFGSQNKNDKNELINKILERYQPILNKRDPSNPDKNT